jgi:hypothetical protein
MFVGDLCLFLIGLAVSYTFLSVSDFMYYLIGMTIVDDLRDNAGHQSVKRYVNEISLVVLLALQTTSSLL